jgi:hypothetical protein
MENEEVVAFKTGRSTLFVYRSPYAGTNKATAVTFVAAEVEDLVRTLKGRGVTFEHYDLPKMVRQGDIHVAGTMKAALVQGPGRQYFQPGHAAQYSCTGNDERFSSGNGLARLRFVQRRRGRTARTTSRIAPIDACAAVWSVTSALWTKGTGRWLLFVDSVAHPGLQRQPSGSARHARGDDTSGRSRGSETTRALRHRRGQRGELVAPGSVTAASTRGGGAPSRGQAEVDRGRWG